MASNTTGPWIPLGGQNGDNAVGIVITPDGSTAYVALLRSGIVVPVNLQSGSTGPAIQMPPGWFSADIAITPNGGTVYVSGEIGQTPYVLPINTGTNTVGSPIPGVPNGCCSLGNLLAMSPDGKTLYVAAGSSCCGSTLEEIDVATNAITAIRALPTITNLRYIAIGSTQLPDQQISNVRGVPFNATEGQNSCGTVATFSDPDNQAVPSEYTASIEWGDSTSSAGTVSGSNGNITVSGCHAYAEEGSDTIKVTITDTDNTGNAATVSTTATVADATLTSTCAMPAFIAQTYSGPTAGFNDSASTGNPADFTASITWGDGGSSTGTVAGGPGLAPYTVSGSHTYATTGPKTITTRVLDDGGAKTVATCSATVFAFGTSSGATFVIGDLAPTGTGPALPGDTVTWWGSQWAKLNPMTGGPPPSSMKGFAGFEDMPAAPTCGSNWTTDPGNSTPPPSSVPDYMGVIVSSHVTQNGSVISGDVKHVVIVRNNPGYAPNPGSPGTGTVLGYLC